MEIRRGAASRHRLRSRGRTARAGAGDDGLVEGQRGEAVFIDYNQNARDRTIASAWSVRRTPIATVSTPVTWDELPHVSPDDFTVRTVAARFAERGDAHLAIDDVHHSLDPLLEMAERDEAGGLGDLPYPPNYPKMPGEPPRVAEPHEPLNWPNTES